MTESAATATDSPATVRPRRPNLPALTGLRFLAAFHVVLYHFGGPIFAGAPATVQNLAGSGYLGVSLFFILSGFILTYTYFDPTQIEFDSRRFWAARFARIYPVYLLGFLIAAPFAIKSLVGAGAIKLTLSALMALTLTQAWAPQTATLWNIPAWSLSVEAFFYAVFPFLAIPLARRLKANRLIQAMAVIWLAGLVPPFLYMATNPDGLVTPARFAPDALWLTALKYSPLTRLPEFLLGVILGRIYLEDLASKRRHDGGRIAATSLVALFFALAISGWLPYPLVHNGLFAPLFAMLIYGLAHGGGVLGLLLRIPVIVLLGEASYGLYILHLHAWPWAMRLLEKISPAIPATPHWSFICYLALMLPAAILVFKYLETPARIRLRQALNH